MIAEAMHFVVSCSLINDDTEYSGEVSMCFTLFVAHGQAKPVRLNLSYPETSRGDLQRVGAVLTVASRDSLSKKFLPVGAILFTVNMWQRALHFRLVGMAYGWGSGRQNSIKFTCTV